MEHDSVGGPKPGGWTRLYPDNTALTYGLNADGSVASIANGAASTSFAYDPAGNLVSTKLPNGYIEARTFDAAGRLSDIRSTKGTTVLGQSTYTRDAMGNPRSIQDGTNLTTLGYDARDQLVDVCFKASCPGAADPYIRYTYDGVGNRLSEKRPTGTTSYAYDIDNQLKSTTIGSTTTTRTYDADGNLTKLGTRTFSYDGEGQMVSTTAGKSTTSYAYDSDGLRVSAATGTQAASIVNSSWDKQPGLAVPVMETNGSGSLIRRYAYAGDELLSMTSGGTEHYFHHDALGSTVNITAADGTTEWTYRYDPFGAIRTQTQNSRKAPANVALFGGALRDADTGLDDLRARMYEPSTGRFTTRDPVGSPTSVPYGTPYGYVGNRPSVLTDPTGLCFIPVACKQQHAVADAVSNAPSAFVDNAGAISAVTGTIAVAVPASAPVLGPISAATGIISAAHAVSEGDVAGAALDTVGAGFGGISLFKMVAKDKALFGLGAVGDSLRDLGATGLATNRSLDWYAANARILARRRGRAGALEAAEQGYSRIAAGLADVSFLRTIVK